MEEETSIGTKYELMLIFSSELSEKETEEQLEEVRSNITSLGGNIYHEDILGLRDLAYVIKKHDQGFYAVINFEMSPEKVRKVEKPLNIEKSVLRYMVMKTPHTYEIKSVKVYEEEGEKEKAEREAAKDNREAKRNHSKPEKKQPKSSTEKPKEKVKEEKVKEEKPKEKEKEEKVKEETPKEETKEKEKVEKIKEETPEEKPEKEEPKEEKSTLDDVDEKLKSIINDPDITL